MPSTPSIAPIDYGIPAIVAIVVFFAVLMQLLVPLKGHRRRFVVVPLGAMAVGLVAGVIVGLALAMSNYKAATDRWYAQVSYWAADKYGVQLTDDELRDLSEHLRSSDADQRILTIETAAGPLEVRLEESRDKTLRLVAIETVEVPRPHPDQKEPTK